MGGRDLTPRKDLPYVIQEKQLKSRKPPYIRKPLNVRVEGEAHEEEELQETNSREEKVTSREGEKERKHKEVEAVLFVPATPGSELRKLIQKAEDQASKLMNSPTV